MQKGTIRGLIVIYRENRGRKIKIKGDVFMERKIVLKQDTPCAL